MDETSQSSPAFPLSPPLTGESPSPREEKRAALVRWIAGWMGAGMLLLLLAYPLSLGPVAAHYDAMWIPVGGGREAQITPIFFTRYMTGYNHSVVELAYSPLMYVCSRNTTLESVMVWYLYKWGKMCGTTTCCKPRPPGVSPPTPPRTWQPSR